MTDIVYVMHSLSLAIIQVGNFMSNNDKNFKKEILTLKND